MRPQTVRSRRNISEEAEAIIGAELREDLTLPGLARRLATSPRQLQRAFSENGRAGFRSYLCRERMTRAAQMLVQSDAEIAHVAKAVGYGTKGQFSRAFSRCYGMTPRSYRRTRSPAPRSSETFEIHC